MLSLSILALLAALAPAAGHVRELVAADRWAEAVEEARALAAASPDDGDAAAALGEALYRAGRIDEAGTALAPWGAREDAPGRALAQLALVRAAEGRDDDAAALFERALAAAPDDRWVLYHASGAARTRAEACRRLNAYLERSEGDDPDRIEGARGTLRFYTSLGERKLWVRTTDPDRVELPLSRWTGSARRGWIVEAQLANKKSIRLLLDTGSSGLFVVERSVKKGGYQPLSEETVFAGGGSGRTRSSRGILTRVALGPLEFQDALVTTTADELDPQGRIHGVLGLSPLSGYLVTLDLAKGRLLLERAPAAPPGAAYWSVGGQMLVRAGARGAPSEGLFLFDTGATVSMLAASYATSVPGATAVSAATVRTYGGHVAGASTVRGVTLAFDGLATSGDPVNQSDLTQRSRLGGVEVSGFLGLDLLDGKVVRIDTVRQRVEVRAPQPR